MLNELLEIVIKSLWQNEFIQKNVCMIETVHNTKKSKMPNIIITSEMVEKKYDIYKKHYLITLYFKLFVENTNPKLSYPIIDNIKIVMDSITLSLNEYYSIGTYQENIFDTNYYDSFHITKTKFNILIKEV